MEAIATGNIDFPLFMVVVGQFTSICLRNNVVRCLWLLLGNMYFFAYCGLVGNPTT